MAIAIVAVIAVLLARHYFFTYNAPAGQPPLAYLSGGSLDALRADFNRAAGGVRVIVLLSPT